MTLSTEMYYTGFNPATMQPVYVPHPPKEKQEQKLMFFYYKKEYRQQIAAALRHNGLHEEITRLTK